MTRDDDVRFATLMGALALAFDRVLIRERIDIYAEGLRDVRIDDLEWAAKEAIRELEFFPKVKQLRDYAAIAPRPRVTLDTRRDQPLLEELPTREEAQRMLREMAETLNSRFGTTFGVDERSGRPSLVALQG